MASSSALLCPGEPAPSIRGVPKLSPGKTIHPHAHEGALGRIGRNHGSSRNAELGDYGIPGTSPEVETAKKMKISPPFLLETVMSSRADRGTTLIEKPTGKLSAGSFVG